MPPAWVFAVHGFDGSDVEVDGVRVFEHGWRATGETAEIRDPLWGQALCFPVYEIVAGDRRVVFAAGEFSNTVWGFFLPSGRAAP